MLPPACVTTNPLVTSPHDKPHYQAERISRYIRDKTKPNAETTRSVSTNSETALSSAILGRLLVRMPTGT
jgi:hypothetical protein